MVVKKLAFVAIALASLALVLAPTAAAHASKNTEDGKYRVTWGLLSEPGFTHEKNRLDLIIRENATGAGVGGLHAENLTITLLYGEEAYDLGNITPNRNAKGSAFAGDGNYTSQNFVYLTRPGIYALHIQGDIRGTPVDLTIPAAHEYESMGEIMFPDEIEIGGGEGGDLAARVAALEAEVQALKAQQQTQSSTPATVTEQGPQNGIPAAGVLVAALAVVGAALILRRRG